MKKIKERESALALFLRDIEEFTRGQEADEKGDDIDDDVDTAIDTVAYEEEPDELHEANGMMHTEVAYEVEVTISPCCMMLTPRHVHKTDV